MLNKQTKVYTRIKNFTNINFNNEETRILELGFNYSTDIEGHKDRYRKHYQDLALNVKCIL